ncbi:MAG: hypothetical protein KIT62_07180 [Cyclobacteriaceae bacterium]|nr:hypothetical protein [Cyclobacteriaceae bacterium]
MDTGNPIGRVDVLLISDSEALVSWMEAGKIKVIRTDREGVLSDIAVVANTSEARSSGFPQMTRLNNQVIFAWTDDEAKVVKSAVMNMDAL